ncbi:MAG: D-alanine--D-alanine ligase family protein [Patescibacteria group bacterium]
MQNKNKKTKAKIRVGVLFGGKSVEHEVSIKSANNVIEALNKKKYEIVPIKIEKNGKFPINIFEQEKINVVFSVCHGSYGEDGSMQGFLKILDIPFVGAGVLGSAVGMDKDVMKRLLKEAEIPIGKFLVFNKGEKIDFEKIVKILNLPIFIKPANLGSSVGVSKVKNEKEFKKAVQEAFKYDSKIIFEEAIIGREIECAVLGGKKIIASVVGEIIPQDSFYSYKAKYLDPNGAILKIPASLPKEIIKKVQNLAIKTFKVLNCEGMGRVDFFLKENGDILVNEINTLPGFTAISMYPKLLEATGISYSKLLDKLIQLAFERSKKEQSTCLTPQMLETNF